MSNFLYTIVIDEIQQTKVGFGNMNPDLIVIHHTGMINSDQIDLIERLNFLADFDINKKKNAGISCHIYIPKSDLDQSIYITRYLNQIQNHTHNSEINQRSISVLLEGNFDIESPTKSQLLKLQQLFDDLHQNSLYPDNPFIKNIKPQDTFTVKSFEQFEIRGGIICHNEIPNSNSKCCGRNLANYIEEYRNKSGNVNWNISLNPNNSLQNELQEARETIKALSEENSELQNQLSLIKNNSENLDNSLEIKDKFDKCESEKNLLQKEIDEKVKLINSLNEQNSHHILEIKTLKDRLVNQNPKIDLDSKQIIKNWKIKFIIWWNKLPVFIRYIIPNLISLGIPSIIFYVERFDLNSIEILGIIGASHSAIKSLVIGYLKALDKKLKESGAIIDFEE